MLLGSWTTDDWAIHLVQLPLSVVQAVVFGIFGVGLVQARFISVAATVAMAAVLLLGLRRPLGLAGATVAAVGSSLSALTLYYGRLALLEPGVALALSVAAVAAVAVERGSVRRWAVVCGVALAVAIGLKANAVPSAVGILLAVGLRGVRERSVRPFPVIAAVIIGLSGLVWFVLVALPNAAALREMLSILPIGTAPRNIEGFIRDIVTYVSVNDGVARLARPLIVGAVAGLLIVVVDLALRSRRPATSERAVAEPAGGLTDGSPPMSGPTRVALVGLLWVVFGLVGVASISYQPNRYVVPVLPGLALLAGAGMAVVAARTAGRALPVRAAGFASVVILLAAPGIAVDGEWVASTGHKALDGQAAVERLVPAGATVAGGYAPLFAMRSPVVTAILFEGTSMNARDLYANGVRWAIEPRGLAPVWVAEHPAAWAARRELWCIDWGRSARPVCLSELP